MLQTNTNNFFHCVWNSFTCSTHCICERCILAGVKFPTSNPRTWSSSTAWIRALLPAPQLEPTHSQPAWLTSIGKEGHTLLTLYTWKARFNVAGVNFPLFSPYSQDEGTFKWKCDPPWWGLLTLIVTLSSEGMAGSQTDCQDCQVYSR